MAYIHIHVLMYKFIIKKENNPKTLHLVQCSHKKK